MQSTRPGRVPLGAGLGPDNPPCPVCGSPLFGWATMRPGATPVRRCERCGLGVAGGAANREEALAALTGQMRVPNGASFQARLGGSGWAGLEPGRRFLFTPASLRLLGVEGAVARPYIAGAWQTLLNGFTFGHNVALASLGRGSSTAAAHSWQRAVDAVVSVLASPLVLVGAVLIEVAAATAGRGGVLRLPPNH
jgi:hypothetical protein